MSPADRKLVIDRLRLVAQQWYDGTCTDSALAQQWYDGTCTDSARYGNGICYAAQQVAGGGGSFWYHLLSAAFVLLGMDGRAPFHGEEHGDGGDWAVRPMFCLLMADALEQME